MNSRKIELSVGAFLLVGLLAVGFFAVRSATGNLLPTRSYTVTARFANVGGLKEGSSVLVAGVTVGQVAKIALSEQFSALIELRLPSGLRLPVDTMASIRTTGLIGAKIVTLSPGSEEETIADGGAILDTESAVDIESLIGRFAFGEAGAAEGEN